jgi:hypothetical protein
MAHRHDWRSSLQTSIRGILVEQGLLDSRVTSTRGQADAQPMFPYLPMNRRVTITRLDEAASLPAAVSSRSRRRDS